jgi:hypothetical protein
VEKPKRKAPETNVLRRLYALSGNVCAWPGCKHPIFDEDGKYVAELCHIEAAETGGERFNQNMTEEQRAAFENLLFLCHEHHVVTDDVAAWTAPKLHRMKADHEARFNDARLVAQVEQQYVDYLSFSPIKRAMNIEGSASF